MTKKHAKPPVGLGVPIGTAARLTGVPAETLRTWERRYGFPRPRRDDWTRIYEPVDLERIRDAARAIEMGHRPKEVLTSEPGRVAQLMLATRQAEAAVREPVATQGDIAKDCVELVVKGEIFRARALLRHAAVDRGPKRFVCEVATPLVNFMNHEWERGALSIHQEHALSSILSSELRRLVPDDESHKVVAIVATLPGELHTLGLEMAVVYLACNGISTRVLGADTPIKEIVDAQRAYGASVIALSVSAAASKRDTTAALRALRRALPDRVELWVGGSAAVVPSLPRVAHLPDWTAVDAMLARRL